MTDTKKKSEKDLLKELSELKQSTFKFRSDVAGSSTRNVKEYRGAQKQIARILTELNSRTNNNKETNNEDNK